MKANLLLLAVLAITALSPARVSAQDEPPSVLKSVGVTAAEVGTGLVVSLAGEYAFALSTMSFRDPSAVPYIILAATPAPAAAGVYGVGAWLDRGGSFGPTVLDGYIGAAVGVASGIAFDFLSHTMLEDYEVMPLLCFPIGCAIGSVVGYKGSRRSRDEGPTSWQLVPPSMGLALRRPANGRPTEIAGVKVNLVGARF